MRSEPELNSGVSLNALATNAVHEVKIGRRTPRGTCAKILNFNLKQPGVHKKADRITVMGPGHADFPPCSFVVICC